MDVIVDASNRESERTEENTLEFVITDSPVMTLPGAMYESDTTTSGPIKHGPQIVEFFTFSDSTVGKP